MTYRRQRMVPNQQIQVKIFEILRMNAFGEIQKILALDLSADTAVQVLKIPFEIKIPTIKLYLPKITSITGVAN